MKYFQVGDQVIIIKGVPSFRIAIITSVIKTLHPRRGCHDNWHIPRCYGLVYRSAESDWKWVGCLWGCENADFVFIERLSTEEMLLHEYPSVRAAGVKRSEKEAQGQAHNKRARKRLAFFAGKIGSDS